MFRALTRYFVRGLLFTVPVAATVYVIWVSVVAIDRVVDLGRWIGWRFPGLGLVVTVAAITLIGFLATNFATRWAFGIAEGVFRRLPLVKLLYTALRDLVEAFVGDRKRFDKPVLVRLDDDAGIAVVGFLTREDLAEAGIRDRVAVYVPQSYNFAGNLIVVPRERITTLSLDSRTAMTLIVSGGVSGEIEPATR